MPALSFSVFLEKILDGSKSNTIRQKRKNPLEAGDTLQLYWSQRRPEGFKIGDAVCKEVRSILIFDKGIKIPNPATEEIELIESPADLKLFAQQDGFDNWQEMRSFFACHYDLPFRGVFIEWHNLKLTAKAQFKLTSHV